MEPAVKPAVKRSTSKRIAVLATKGTLEGRLFKKTMHNYEQDAYVQIIVGEGLVELVEQGKESSPEAVGILRELLRPALHNGVDTLVLGCTHYPFLSAAIDVVTGGAVALVDAAMPVAMQTKRLVVAQRQQNAEVRVPSYSFYTSGNIDILRRMQERHLRLPNVRYEMF
jgi:glutamate racemase